MQDTVIQITELSLIYIFIYMFIIELQWQAIISIQLRRLLISILINIKLLNRMNTRVSTGIPGYGLRTEMIRKFFPFPLWKRFRKTGIPERFFSVKQKFPERCSGISFRKFPVSGTFGTRITLKSYICKYNTSQ